MFLLALHQILHFAPFQLLALRSDDLKEGYVELLTIAYMNEIDEFIFGQL